MIHNPDIKTYTVSHVCHACRYVLCPTYIGLKSVTACNCMLTHSMLWLQLPQSCMYFILQCVWRNNKFTDLCTYTCILHTTQSSNILHILSPYIYVHIMYIDRLTLLVLLTYLFIQIMKLINAVYGFASVKQRLRATGTTADRTTILLPNS